MHGIDPCRRPCKLAEPARRSASPSLRPCIRVRPGPVACRGSRRRRAKPAQATRTAAVRSSGRHSSHRQPSCVERAPAPAAGHGPGVRRDAQVTTAANPSRVAQYRVADLDVRVWKCVANSAASHRAQATLALGRRLRPTKGRSGHCSAPSLPMSSTCGACDVAAACRRAALDMGVGGQYRPCTDRLFLHRADQPATAVLGSQADMRSANP